MLLVGDLGGTNVRLAPVLADGRPGATERFEVSRFSDFRSVLEAFVARCGKSVDSLCLGVAGPVREGRAMMTNVDWEIDAQRLKAECGLAEVTLINDLEATAYSIGGLGDGDYISVRDGALGTGAGGNIALIAPGTGLGEAFIVAGDRGEVVVATEGGHADFAPADALQDELLQYCRARREHVSYEYVCSGPGIAVIFDFLCRRAGGDAAYDLLSTVGRAANPVAAIVDSAMGGKAGSDVCREALELFVAIVAAEAGNLALTVMATGGIWIAGGIAPRILPLLTGPGFAETIAAKGRMSRLVASMPVRVVTNTDAALIGAARYMR